MFGESENIRLVRITRITRSFLCVLVFEESGNMRLVRLMGGERVHEKRTTVVVFARTNLSPSIRSELEGGPSVKHGERKRGP